MAKTKTKPKQKAQSAEILNEYRKERKRIQNFMRRAEKRGYVFQTQLPEIPQRITEASVRRLQRITPKSLYENALYIIKETGEVVEGSRGRHIERRAAAEKQKSSAKFKQFERNITARHKRILEEIEKARQQGEEIEEHEEYIPTQKSEKYVPDESNIIISNVEETVSKIDSAYLETVEGLIKDWQEDPNWTPSLAGAKRHDRNVLLNALKGAIAEEGRAAVAARLSANAELVADLVNSILYASGSVEGNFKNGRTRVNENIAQFSAIIKGRPLTIDEAQKMSEYEDQNDIDW